MYSFLVQNSQVITVYLIMVVLFTLNNKSTEIDT